MRQRYWWMIAFFLLLCAGIAISQWYAYNVNVPHYQTMHDRSHRN